MLDIGAGTGLIGLKLKEKQNMEGVEIFGIDACSSFVHILGDSPNYIGSQQLLLGRGDNKFPEELREQFDIVTASGVWLKGHIPAAAMDDCYSALKPNGFFITAMRSSYYTLGNEEGYREKLNELVAEGKLSLVRTQKFMRGREGHTGLFSPQESRLLCYQKRSN